MKLPNLNLFKRNFVSLVVTPKQLKAIRVNTKTNTVIKFAQIDVPPGVIVNYQVQDKETLVKLISELWTKNKIGEKYVGVVVPEFSTYTKSLTLPNLTDTEISEALSIKIQDYIPVSVDEVIFDWKTIKRDKKNAEVLVVAISKAVLFGYIDAIAAAGLSPLVVETPSLSILRIIDGDETGKLIIYLTTSEAVLVIAIGGKIIASSVITSGNFNTIVGTARQMLTHYKEVSIDKVMISGVGLTQDLVQFLNYNLGSTVQFANVQVKGMLPAQVQDFLVGVSLQQKNPAEPLSELTINLLPPAWAEYYKKQSLGIREWTLTLIASIIIWTTFLSALIVFMFLSLKLQNLKNDSQVAAASELNKAVSDVKDINSLADTVINFDDNTVYPQSVISLLSSAKPAGVSIDYYKVNYDSGQVIIDGNADVVESLISFRDALKAKDELDKVDLPIDTLVQQSNIDFEISAIYKSFVKDTKKPVKLKIQ